MVERLEEIKVRSASCDEQSNTTTSTAENEIGDEVQLFQKRFQMLNQLCYIGTYMQMITRSGTVQSGDFI